MNRKEAIQWWKEAKLGLFIHWGVYSLLGRAEWVMYDDRIPVGEYEKLPLRFKPDEFDADKWVQFAKENGMKYIIITAKHHDGFSMFRTKVSPYNIVDATPFGRDPMEELAKACRKAGIKLGFYYSHVREWHHPMACSLEKKGRGDLYGNYGNFWDYPNENLKDLQVYIDEFDIPQIKELLTQYGDVLTIWFDTPSQITPKQGRQIRQAVYESQEGCLVNSRLSEDIEADYMTMADDGIPAAGLDCPWETPMTTHNGWGYVENAHYQAPSETIRKIVEVSAKGGNLLLNVGPDSQGQIPPKAVEGFHEIGNWLKKYGEAIYGTKAAGLPYFPQWGYVTRKENALYLLVTDTEVQGIALTGLESRVEECTALENGDALKFGQNGDKLWVDIGKLEGEIRVVKVFCPEGVKVKEGLYPSEDGSVVLPASHAMLQREYPYSKMDVKCGVTSQWYDIHDSLIWEFENTQMSEYTVQVLWDSKDFWRIEDFGHKLEVKLNGAIFECCVSDEVQPVCGTRYIDAGKIRLGVGKYKLELIPKYVVMDQLMGLRISGVKLKRVDKCDGVE